MSDEPTRREVDEFKKQFRKIVPTEDPELFRMLLRAWEVEPGSIAWELAWEAWGEQIAERHVAPPPPPPPPRRPGSSPGAGRA